MERCDWCLCNEKMINTTMKNGACLCMMTGNCKQYGRIHCFVKSVEECRFSLGEDGKIVFF